LSLIEGNPGHQKLNALEPQPMVVAPTMPKHLDPDARRAWRHLCPMLLRVRILTEVDGNTLAAYCQVYSTWKQLREQINKKGVGALLMKTPKGNLQQSPLFTMERDCINQLASLGRELGLSPSARTRVNVCDPFGNGPMDPFEAALCR
jgi:P27 family predicted phage terminase small subunit